MIKEKLFPILRGHTKMIFGTLVILAVCAFLVYERVSPGGFLAGLKNDLRLIEPEAEYAYTDLSGNTVNLSDFKGKPLIINAWATWMPFSKTELPLLARIQEKYKEDIQIIAMNRKEDRLFIQGFLSTYGIPSDSLVFLVDPSDNFYTTVGGFAMPETVVYRKDGTIAQHVRGVLEEGEMDSLIETLIQE